MQAPSRAIEEEEGWIKHSDLAKHLGLTAEGLRLRREKETLTGFEWERRGKSFFYRRIDSPPPMLMPRLKPEGTNQERRKP